MTAVKLLSKLLEPDPDVRKAHFTQGRSRRPLEILLHHPFFRGEKLDAATLARYKDDVAEQRNHPAESVRLAAAETMAKLL